MSADSVCDQECPIKSALLEDVQAAVRELIQFHRREAEAFTSENVTSEGDMESLLQAARARKY